MTTRLSQRGLSLIELMLGIAIGLFIVGAAGALLVGHLREHRALMLDTRMTQDLRHAADLVTRELRRAGHWGHAGSGTNPYAALAPTTSSSDTLSLHYSTDATENDSVDAGEQFGFRLRNGAIELQLGAGNWQAVTDQATLQVTAFEVAPTLEEIDLDRFCPVACAPGGGLCPPRQQVRHVAVTITAALAGDARVTRSVRSAVRVRSDALVGACSL